MTVGQVNARLQARVSIEVIAESGANQRVEAVLDTGFSGSLSLPTVIVRKLGLVQVSRQDATLADGSIKALEVFRARVVWAGQTRRIEVQAIDSVPLLGMELLHPFSVRLDVTNGGAVELTPLAP